MSETSRRTFPLVPRWRVAGIPFGEQRSLRRGPGSDVAGSREYGPGDPVSTIDWYASARLSSARGGDEFVVREKYAEEAPRVVVLCDRRPSMALYPPRVPVALEARRGRGGRRRDRRQRARRARRDRVPRLRRQRAARRRAVLAAAEGPRRRWEVEERHATLGFDAPEDNVERALDYLARAARRPAVGELRLRRLRLPRAAAARVLAARAALRWDVVPVIVQDPVWEQSFPDARSVTCRSRSREPDGSSTSASAASEARARRAANEARLGRLLGRASRRRARPGRRRDERPARDRPRVPRVGRAQAAGPKARTVSRGRLLAVAGLAAAVVVALVLVATLGGGGGDAPAPRGDVAISTSIAPSPLFFGDSSRLRAQRSS